MSRRTLDGAIATPDGKRRYVRTLFATIADRYDFITRALSYGQDRRWKRRLVSMASPTPGTSVLDLATGTGDIAAACADRGAHVVGLDLTQRMIELAHARHGARVRFLVGDMLALPFPSASFDIVTTGYGLRNVPDLALALGEIQRVLKPGGAHPLARLQSAVEPYRSRGVPDLSRRGRRVSWLGPPSRSRYVPIHPRVDPALSRRGRRRAADADARIFANGISSCSWRPDGDPPWHSRLIRRTGPARASSRSCCSIGCRGPCHPVRPCGRCARDAIGGRLSVHEQRAVRPLRHRDAARAVSPIRFPSSNPSTSLKRR